MKFISPASFWTPDYIVESAWLEHAPFAFWLMEAHRPRVVAELGAHRGFSYCCFCQAIERLGLNARAYAIDTWKGDEHAGFYGDDVFQELSAYHERYSSFSRLVRSTFDEALPHFEDGSVDLLHIDGQHFYDDIKRDFESWRPKLSSRGVVLFHDTNVRERGFGVFQFWSEIKGDHPSLEFVHCHGLGVLGAGGDQSSELLQFFTASKDDASARAVREAYARLGHGGTTLASNKMHAATAEAERQRFAQQTGTERQAQETRLLAEKEQHVLALNAERERHWQQLAAEKERYDASLNAAAEREQARSVAETERFTAVLEAEKERHRLELAAEKQRHQTELAAAVQRLESQLAVALESAEANARLLHEAGQAELVREGKISELNDALRVAIAQNETLKAEIAKSRSEFDYVYQALRRARKKPASTALRYYKWKTSKNLVALKSIMGSRFEKRMHRRRAKNAPDFLKIFDNPTRLIRRPEKTEEARHRKWRQSRAILAFSPILPASFVARIRRRLEKNAPVTQDNQWAHYASWIKKFDTLDEADRERVRRCANSLSQRPLISILMPTYNTPAQWLEKAIGSVRRQLYDNWELCIADDASTERRVRKILARYAAAEPRIKVHYRKKNGHISACSNDALALATGDYIGLLDHDDELHETALFHVALEVNRHPNAGIIFSDEDKIDISGNRQDPYFKCGFSYDLFLAQNLICHLGVYRRELVHNVGGFRTNFEGSQGNYHLGIVGAKCCPDAAWKVAKRGAL